jgi:hypothetical protein
MKKFQLNVYRLCEYWTKEIVEVEAETQKDAVNNIEDGVFETLDFEVLYETEHTRQVEIEDKNRNVLASW